MADDALVITFTMGGARVVHERCRRDQRRMTIGKVATATDELLELECELCGEELGSSIESQVKRG